MNSIPVDSDTNPYLQCILMRATLQCKIEISDILPAQLGRVENVSLMSSVDFNECVESFLVANVTRWGGIFSPNVRVSFAIRFLRVSEGVGDTGVVGTGVNGEGGSRAESVGGVSV